MKNLPIGIQDFRELRDNNYLYVDKTQEVYNLVTTGKYYFLSRPRRFGKSLLLSTMKYLFQGERTLFNGLWIEDKWNWETQNPVLHISFSSLGYKDLGLKEALLAELQVKAEEQGITLSQKGLTRRFRELFKKVAQKGKVVLLIDEYDKPLIDYLGKDIKQALAHQEILKNFYSVIKDSDNHIQLLFITGVSKFSKVGVFSDLNNLRDLTMSRRFGTICGYTEEELRHYFTEYAEQSPTPEYWAKIKEWYNGYSWGSGNYVYNPFSILNFFAEGEFQNYWFQSGTPTFLINLLQQHFYYDFEGKEVGSAAFERYDLKKLEIVPLLFQTGYLTIKEKIRNRYRLGYPNLEVKESMLQHLIGAFAHEEISASASMEHKLEEAFIQDDMDNMISLLNSLFAGIPHQLFEQQNERYYHALVHLLFSYLGIYIQSEVNTSRGRADAVVQTDTHIYIIEFKLDKSAKEALEQIKQKGYAEKHRHGNKTIKLLGINFSSKKKRVEEWLIE